MKKSLLLIVPALFSLCACNTKRELSVEEAAVITKKIDAEFLNIKNYKVVYNISNTRGKGNSFEEELVNSQMMINDDLTFYLKSVNSHKGMFELYHAFDPIYEEIYYKYLEKLTHLIYTDYRKRLRRCGIGFIKRHCRTMWSFDSYSQQGAE